MGEVAMRKMLMRETAKKVLLCLLVVLPLAGFMSAEAQKPGSLPSPKFTEKGTDGCLECHAGSKMTVVADSPHGNKDNPHTPYAQQGCESCHGKGSLHSSRARGGHGFPALIQFKRRGSPVAEQNGACLDCHAKDMGSLAGMDWTGSLHDNGRITCGNCHDSHTTDNKMARQTDQTRTCARCHRADVQDHPRFAGKGIAFDELKCSTCHDVHQLFSAAGRP